MPKDLLNIMAKQAGSPELQQLFLAKAESDRKNYQAKHKIIQDLIKNRPDDFTIDSDNPITYGITHIPTGFRFHLPRLQTPNMLKASSPSASITATSPSPTPVVQPTTPPAESVLPPNSYKQDNPTPYTKWRDDILQAGQATDPVYGTEDYTPQFKRIYRNADPELQKYMQGKIVKNDQSASETKLANPLHRFL